MKKILYIFWIILLSFFNSAFAEVNITLNSDRSNIDISELVELRIDIIATENETIWNVEVAGIDDFNVVSQSVNNSTRILNGSSTENYTLILTLKASKSWEYQIGPIKVWEITSNTLALEVTWDELFIGWQQDVNVQNNNNTQDQNQPQSIIPETLSEEILLGAYDAYDEAVSWTGKISGLMGNTQISPIDIQKTFFAILFLIALFFAYKLYFTLKTSPLLEPKPVPVAPIRIDYYDLLEKIEEGYIKAEKSIFYAQLSSLLRRYLDDRVAQWLSTKTLTQVRSKLEKNKELYKLYETIYYPEYNKEKDSPEQRIDILESLKQELQ